MLTVPDCPNARVLDQRLAELLAGRPDVTVTRFVITDERGAAAAGMHGSPTLLVDGRDPFAGPDTPAGLSCRIYRDADGGVTGAPPIAALRTALGLRGTPARTPAERGCCGHVNFFATPGTAHAWAVQRPDVTGQVLGREHAEHLGAAIFGRLLIDDTTSPRPSDRPFVRRWDA